MSCTATTIGQIQALSVALPPLYLPWQSKIAFPMTMEQVSIPAMGHLKWLGVRLVGFLDSQLPALWFSEWSWILLGAYVFS